ncbi:MAG: exodeoxyribonuclease VII large subunit [Rhodospirillales bacterium]|nr:exodeoxyribonuclease VII large subunit [Rhodospirillales bacterium]MCB9965747.1 exodeoxyribonuclease VII large subunit [Rhodospirillales bacterium]
MQQSSLPLNNVPEFSVSELAFSLKKTVEETYGRVRLRGELGRLTFHSSGHMYGNIKDDKATIDVICWRGTLSSLSVRPEEGLEVICTGKMSTYPARSNYQFLIDGMELAGEGALLKLLEQRRKKLMAEGLFEPQRKKPLPFLPRTIGVITSPTGAVIRDILHRLRDRFPVRVLLYPVRVQGETAAQEIVVALHGFARMAPPPDTLILARGGGSLEDLMPFNEEEVVRAVAGCPIPIITAIGHETDTTLVDFAADLRAPTPTGAAEMAVPVRSQLHAQVQEDSLRLNGAIQRHLEAARTRLSATRLGAPSSLLDLKTQRMDHVTLKLQSSYEAFLSVRREKIGRLSAGLRHPRLLISEKSRLLDLHTAQLSRLPPRLLDQKVQKLENISRILESLSFKSVLARGYAVVKESETGRVISDPAQVSSGQKLDLLLKNDNIIKTTAD